MSSSSPDPSVIAALIGHSQAGKTTLIERQKNFDASATELGVCGTTMGLAEFPFQIMTPSGNVNLTVRECFATVVSVYLRNIHVGVICFDPTNKAWEDAVKKNLETLRSVNSTAKVVVIATKYDLWTNKLNPVDLERQACQILDTKLFMVTSAHVGTHVRDAFVMIASAGLTVVRPLDPGIVINDTTAQSKCC
jgi:GTPase SAR1 family protein